MSKRAARTGTAAQDLIIAIAEYEMNATDLPEVRNIIKPMSISTTNRHSDRSSCILRQTSLTTRTGVNIFEY